MNSSDFYLSFKMYNRLLLSYLFFLSILNINLSTIAIQKINKFIVIMVLLQIPAAVYKYLKYGVREDGIIGTFSTQAGALSTIVPLFIIGYLIALYYCYKRNPLYLLLIPCFMFFAWGGGKRAFFIFLPTLLFLGYFIYNTTLLKINILKMIPTLMGLLIVIGITLYLGGRLNPVFNPEKERWGSFDLEYMLTQTMAIQDKQFSSGSSIGRISSFKSAYERIINGSDLSRKLLGDGPDRLEAGNDQREKYGITYGISGATFYLISSGLIGTLSFFSLFLIIGVKAYKSINGLQDPFYIAIAFGTILATIVFCFDFLFYSVVFFTGYIPSLLFFYLAAILFKQHKNKESTSPEGMMNTF
ncbi:MAG: hypothetical protein ACFCUM_05950 [Bacteroidales bacterium]